MPGNERICPTCGASYATDALFCPKDGAPLGARREASRTDPYVGLALPERIELGRLVGIGSMGRVYQARQAHLDRAVAVKILHREHTRNPTLVARFQREGRVAGKLLHPNVIVVHALGEIPPQGGAEEGQPYLVMEFLDGLSLRSALAAGGGAMTLERALRSVIQICDAMGEAHADGVVHRDLKPENVMLVRIGADPDFVKVLDFGVARVGEADSSVATHAGAILGTATYACPESARGDRVGPPGDVYSIATVLFECIGGRPPFVGKGPVDVLIQHAQAAAPDIRSLPRAAELPDPLARVIARGLAKTPGERHATAREFGLALVDAARLSGLDTEPLVARRTLLSDRPANPRAFGGEPLTAVVKSTTLRNVGSPE